MVPVVVVVVADVVAVCWSSCTGAMSFRTFSLVFLCIVCS